MKKLLMTKFAYTFAIALLSFKGVLCDDEMAPIPRPPAKEEATPAPEKESVELSTVPQSHDDSQERIVGGIAIPISKAPYQVCIMQLSPSDRFKLKCGGVLIKMDKVLTAAHCIADEEGAIMPISLFRVYAGHSNLRDMSQYSDVKKMQVHEKYRVFRNGMMWDDLGVIVLKKSFKKSNSIQTIKMRTTPVKEGQICTVTGWGSLIKGGRPSSELRAGEVAIYNSRLCTMSYERGIGIPLHPDAICAGYRGGGVDSCDGDYGGPLVCQGVLTGIASFSLGCGEEEYPGVFVDILSHKKFIGSSSAMPTNSLLLGIILQLIIFSSY